MPLDPQAKALLDFIGVTTLPGIETMTPDAVRDRSKMFAEARKQMAQEPIHAVRDVKMNNTIRLRIYMPEIAKPAPALVYFHGGGWVLGDLDMNDPLCRSIANKVGCVIVSVDYRLAPEAKFPAAVDDCYAAAKWVSSNAELLGVDANRIAIGGDSAGGNLTAVVCQLARDRGGVKPVYQVLIYPATDLRMAAPSIEENAAGPLLTKAGMEWFIGHYLNGESDKTNPLASPLLASNLAGLPPAFVLTAECDPIRDEGEQYGEALRRAGVAVDIKRYAGMPHGFVSFGAALEGSREAVEDIVSRLRGAFGMASAAAD